MLTVACVLKSGGIYNAEWVRKLRDGVARNLTVPYRFVCLSDVDVPCERIPLIGADYGDTRLAGNGWIIHPRWWSKLELFRPGLFDGPALYFDLDSLIIGSLDEVASYPHKMTVVADFYSGRVGSGMLAWNGDYSFIHEAFCADARAIMHRYDNVEPHRGRIGDQAFIEDQFSAHSIMPEVFQKQFPGKFVSYKVHRCENGPPPGAAAICFHGQPKAHELSNWVSQVWK